MEHLIAGVTLRATPGEYCAACAVLPIALLYFRYHDEEWGRPEHDDHKLFELLILEGAQVGPWMRVFCIWSEQVQEGGEMQTCGGAAALCHGHAARHPGATPRPVPAAHKKQTVPLACGRQVTPMTAVCC
jgi:hypothetical protein